MMAQRADAFVDRLVQAVPSLRQMWDQHRKEFGDQAAEAFLRTLAFVTVNRYLSGDPGASGELGRVLRFLETQFGADPDNDRLVVVSFLANLPGPGDPGGRALDLLGPTLRGQLESQRQGKGVPVPSPTADMVTRLVRSVPVLESDLREHIEFYDELLPHLFMGEVTPQLVDWLQAGDVPRARAVLDALEAEYGKDYQVDELIGASFIENLPTDDSVSVVVELLGPKLRAVFDRQRGR